MKLRYTVESVDDGYRAVCPDLDLAASGATESEAVDALRTAALDEVTHVEAMAPPSNPPPVELELIADDALPPREPMGPGDPMRN